jgi:hypothetical protein
VIGWLSALAEMNILRLAASLALLFSLTASAAVHRDLRTMPPDNPASGSTPSMPGDAGLDNVLHEYGIERGSEKAGILAAWFDKISHDPVIARSLPGGVGALDRVFLDADQRDAVISRGIAHLSAADRLLYLQLFTRLFDELVPVNCFGLVDIVAVMNRITIAQMSNADAELYLRLLYKVLVSSASDRPLRSPPPQQYSEAVDALSRAVVIELEGDPFDLDQYQFYTTHPSAATPSDICWLTRVTLHAIGRLPRSQRDIFLLPALTNPNAASPMSPGDASPAGRPPPASARPPSTTIP